MKINVEQLKALVEAGDTSAIEKHILNEALEKSDVYGVLEKGDIVAAAKVNAEVKSELDSEKDIHHNAALTTFKEKKLPGLLEEAKNEVRKELNPDETEDQKALRELRAEFEREKEKNVRAELRTELLKLATGDDVKLPSDFVSKHLDKFVPMTIPKAEDGNFDVETVKTTAVEALKGLATDFNTVVSAQVEEKMKTAGRDDLGGGVGGRQEKKPLLGEELAKNNQHAQALQQQNDFFGKKK